MATAKPRRGRTRIEQDTMGQVPVPASALYGAQTARALENFPISGLRAHPAFVDATVRVKIAAARANARLGLLPRARRARSSRPRARCSPGSTATSSSWTSTRPGRAPPTT